MKTQGDYASLDDLIDAAVHKKLCTQMYCSTCGAYHFRQEVANFLAAKMGISSWETSHSSGSHSLTTPQLTCLLEELRSVDLNRPVAARASYMGSRFEGGHKSVRDDRIQAIRFLIKDVWNNSNEKTRDQYILKVLNGTYAGDIFEGMLAHYRKDLQRWADQKERYSPEGVARRLEEKAALRDERLLRRSIQKVEIDRVWMASQKQDSFDDN